VTATENKTTCPVSRSH